MYSFGILTYNQQNDIVRALESIKYQIEKFSHGAEVELIVSDDASKDGTVLVTQMWIERYSSYFKRVKLIVHNQNVGTCKNISGIYREITGDKFFCFAGDDAIAHNNIFEYLNHLDTYDIESACYCAFSNGEIIDVPSYYNRLCARSYQTGSQLKYLSVARVPVDGPTMAFNKKHLSEGLTEFICRYKLIEDRPTVYYLAHRIKNIRYHFYPKIQVLYQHSNSSVSHLTEGEVKSASLKDLSDFYAYCVKDACSLNSKWTAFCNYMRFCGKDKYKHLNVPYYILVLKDAIYRRQRKALYEEMRKDFPACQAHLKYLEKRKQEFLESMGR